MAEIEAPGHKAWPGPSLEELTLALSIKGLDEGSDSSLQSLLWDK